MSVAAVPDDALRKASQAHPRAPRVRQSNAPLVQVVTQLNQQYGEARQQLVMTQQQFAGRERERRANTLTLREIEALPRGGGKEGTTLYKGVGRMFMQESRNNIENTLKAKEKEIGEGMNVLAKKAKYLETEMKTAEGSLRDLMQEHAR